MAKIPPVDVKSAAFELRRADLQIEQRLTQIKLDNLDLDSPQRADVFRRAAISAAAVSQRVAASDGPSLSTAERHDATAAMREALALMTAVDNNNNAAIELADVHAHIHNALGHKPGDVFHLEQARTARDELQKILEGMHDLKLKAKTNPKIADFANELEGSKVIPTAIAAQDAVIGQQLDVLSAMFNGEVHVSDAADLSRMRFPMRPGSPQPGGRLSVVLKDVAQSLRGDPAFSDEALRLAGQDTIRGGDGELKRVPYNEVRDHLVEGLVKLAEDIEFGVEGGAAARYFRQRCANQLNVSSLAQMPNTPAGIVLLSKLQTIAADVDVYDAYADVRAGKLDR